MSTPPEAIPETWTVLSLLRWTAGYFDRKGVEAPRAGAELLLAHCLKLKRLDLYLRYDQPLSADELARFKALIQRRVRGEPVAYIIGERAFWTLDLRVDPRVLIPRPETERLVEIALGVLQAMALPRPRVLDLGTGSGAIVLALAAEHPQGYFVALDRSLGALQVARENQLRNGISAEIDYLAADWCAPIRENGERFDLIVSNPPYIAAGEIDALQTEVSRFEPRPALDGGPDGLDSLRLILHQAARRLSPGGHLILEIGADQGEPLAALAAARSAFGEAEIHKDYAGLDRVALLRRK
jgi:release factor glutamine methyltransferase